MTTTAATTVETPQLVTRPAKFVIGAVAGMCLVLLRLLEVNFFLGQPRDVILGGFLGMTALAVLAACTTAYLAEDEDPPRKLFLQGLLAPSLLVAVVHQGGDVGPGLRPAASIPTLEETSLWLIQPLHAEEQPDPHRGVPVVILKAADLGNTRVRDGISVLLGRASSQQPFVYVVGQAAAQQEASRTAEQLHAAGVDGVAVTQVQGARTWYVTIGELQSAAQANRLREATVERFARDRSANDTTLRLLINGPVVDARRLAK